MDGNRKPELVKCPRCGIYAHPDISSLFGSAYLTVRDGECSYSVVARTYVLECGYVNGRRDGFFSATENPCPNLKKTIVSTWRTAA
jgi:hypothetical protein